MRLPDLPPAIPPGLMLPPPPPEPDGWLVLLVEMIARLLGL